MGRERLKDPHHPTQKPVKVLEHIIQLASQKGGLVYDPFMGVGSTGVAALQLGRKFLGVDLDEQYVAAAAKRLQEAEGKASLFDLDESSQAKDRNKNDAKTNVPLPLPLDGAALK